MLLCVDVMQMKEQITGPEAPAARRRRLPRCIRGDRVLMPFSVEPAMGLALLHSSGVGSISNLVKGAGSGLNLVSIISGGTSPAVESIGDSYEGHLTLPMGNVAMITNYRLLLLSAPEFAVMEASVLSGSRKQVCATDSGTLQCCRQPCIKTSTVWMEIHISRVLVSCWYEKQTVHQTAGVDADAHVMPWHLSRVSAICV